MEIMTMRFYNDHDQDGQMLEGCWGLFHDQEDQATAIFFHVVFDQNLIEHITEDLHCGSFHLRRVWTSEELEALEIEQLETVTEDGQFDYLLTEAEQQWLEWIEDRYSISTLLNESTCSQGVLTADSETIGRCLRLDGVDRPPCLSEDTQLARLIWFIGPLSED